MMRITRYLAASLALVALVLVSPPTAPRLNAQSVLTGYLSDNLTLTKIADHTTAGTSDVTSASVDMSGYTNVLFLTSFGTAATNNDCHVEQSSDDGSVDTFADLTGTDTTAGSSDEDVFIDVRNPRERYVRLICERGTSSTLESIWAFKYGARSLPVDNTTTGTIAGEQHNSPAEGTK